jgi:hypothetical protein
VRTPKDPAVRIALQRFRLSITPQRMLAVAFLILLGYLVLVPLGVMLLETFIVHPIERFQIPGSAPGDYTTAHWQRTFVGPEQLRVLLPAAHQHHDHRVRHVVPGARDRRHRSRGSSCAPTCPSRA